MLGGLGWSLKPRTSHLFLIIDLVQWNLRKTGCLTGPYSKIQQSVYSANQGWILMRPQKMRQYNVLNFWDHPQAEREIMERGARNLELGLEEPVKTVDGFSTRITKIYYCKCTDYTVYRQVQAIHPSLIKLHSWSKGCGCLQSTDTGLGNDILY